MQRFSFLFLTFSLFVMSFTYSQEGEVTGVVIDGSTGEPLPFVNILVKEKTTGVSTDLDGKFTLVLSPGHYVLDFSYIGYKTIIKEIDVKPKEVLTLGAISLSEEGDVLEEVVVTARQTQNTETALSTLKRKSVSVVDGISAQTFSRSGDSNAADAIKRVTGVSIQNGKNVYVRGLGDRYTKTIFNGMEIPGLDPDKNAVQIDIFPTNIIDNILVFKTFTPDLPGDFSGGVVNIVPKDFPERKSMKLSLSGSFNPNSNLINDFRSYDGGRYDKLGFDDGTRALGFDPTTEVPDESLNDPALYRMTKAMGSELAANPTKSKLNGGASFSIGNRHKLDKVTIGYIASLNYKRNWRHYDHAEYGFYVAEKTDDYEMSLDRGITGAQSTINTLTSALVGGAIKTAKHKVGFTLLSLINGEDRAAKLEAIDYADNPSTIERDVLYFSERRVTTLDLHGKHLLKEGKWETKWKISPSFVSLNEPDVRSTGFELTSDGKYLLHPAVGADVRRSFRNLKENMINSKVDIKYNFTQWNDQKASIKFGFLGLAKQRDYSILTYLVRVKNQGEFDYQGNPDNILKEENLWTPDRTQGAYIKGNYEPANTFNASQMVFAGYAMSVLPINKQLKLIFGARAEQSTILYTGQNNLGTKKFVNEQIMDNFSILPSTNIVYSPREKMNIRLSYNRTLARPTFKEKSLAQIQDPITGRNFIGNPNLKVSNIDNLDLRWENYFENGELVSISAFYKYFTNPIELESYNEVSPDSYTPRNHDHAQALGVEVEVKKNLGFIAALHNFYWNINASWVQSAIKRSNKVGLYDNDTRTMVGQAPYLVNSGLSYRGDQQRFEANLSYNVQGPQLIVVGIGVNPDVYEQPFHALDTKVTYRFGSNKAYKLGVSVNNILDSERLTTYDAGTKNTGTYIWSKYVIGRTYGLSLSATF
ncbi:MAG TPA: TonB-dependent receptor [Saprospiraceae bacterium]|nr:TonB-dependent receptor [Saprospiraceae bacterium]